MECTLEAETSVSHSTQYNLFIGDDKKCTLFGMTFSFNILGTIADNLGAVVEFTPI